MKSERRHELQHNALLDWLMQSGAKSKPYLNGILLALVVVLLGFVGYRWMSTTSAARQAAAWDSVFSSVGGGDIARLDQTVDDYPNTTAAHWAAVIAGDMRLAAGCQELFTTKATAADQFQKALEKYELVLDSSRDDVIRERATYGLARTYEAMAGTRQSQEDLDNAKREFKKIVQWPNGAYVKAAQARLDALNQTSTKEFYDALAAWEPRPAITSPDGLDNLNIPFGNSGEGLNVGQPPKDLFAAPSDKTDDSTQAPASGEPAEPAGQPPAEAVPAEVSPMPAATGDKPAEKAEEDAK